MSDLPIPPVRLPDDHDSEPPVRLPEDNDLPPIKLPDRPDHDPTEDIPDPDDGLPAYPDPGVADYEGFLGWCWVFGRGETGLQDELLPPSAEQDTAAPDAGAPPAALPVPVSRTALPPPRTLQLPFGVNVAGYLRAELGVGEVGRQMLTALDAVGVPALPVTAIAPNSPVRHSISSGRPRTTSAVCGSAVTMSAHLRPARLKALLALVMA